ncbi:hypothetical protein Dda_6709 [Drechslerella dactyloides]|uniref:Uncharacterized protein n=1 Tax=Drechslerella dactyloides TaxID=74499 RepID=A0AAD6IXY7_DREDA|nr:hypothetical protein Dda_6709 [Drechslerella dactyloides]
MWEEEEEEEREKESFKSGVGLLVQLGAAVSFQPPSKSKGAEQTAALHFETKRTCELTSELYRPRCQCLQQNQAMR